MESNQNELQDDGEMTIVSHLSELRKRLILCLLVIGFFSTISYYFAEEIVHFITAPAGSLHSSTWTCDAIIYRLTPTSTKNL